MYRMVLRHDVGGKAPDFTLKNQNGEDVKLSDHTGKHSVLLVFYLGGYDKFAVRSLNSMRENYPVLKELNCEVIAITPELPGKVRSTVESLRLPFDVLSDSDFVVSKEFDVYNPNSNWTYPAAFLIDSSGMILYSYRGASPPNTPHLEYIISKLRSMK